MATKEKLRKTILNKIEKLSDDKLPNLDAYITDLETVLSSDRSPLSFSGIFKDLELNELTDELHKTRGDITQRIPEF
ncbi:MAG: hypothetical protein JXR10_07220 [Cyclobacteriaceae bacterium]